MAPKKARKTLVEIRGRRQNVPPLESSSGRGLAGERPGITPKILAVNQIRESPKFRSPSGDNNSTPKEPLGASSIESIQDRPEDLPIGAFECWFTNRRVARPQSAHAQTTKRSRGSSSTFPLSTTRVHCNTRNYRHSLPPSTDTMSGSTGPNFTSQAVSDVQALREKLAKSREERNAKVAATRNARNTLSISPHPIPTTGIHITSRSTSIAPIEQVSANPVATPKIFSVSEKLPSHHSVLAVPQSSPHDIPRGTGIPQTQSTTTSINSTQTPFGSPQLGPAEYVIGLPLRTKCVTLKGIDQKTAYLNSIVGKHKEIQRYLADPGSADAALVQTMQEIVEQSGRIATHPDLPFDKVGISTGAAEKEAEYHAAMSSKFVFLRSFLTAIRQLFLKVVIVAESGKLIVWPSDKLL